MLFSPMQRYWTRNSKSSRIGSKSSVELGQSTIIATQLLPTDFLFIFPRTQGSISKAYVSYDNNSLEWWTLHLDFYNLKDESRNDQFI